MLCHLLVAYCGGAMRTESSNNPDQYSAKNFTQNLSRTLALAYPNCYHATYIVFVKHNT